MSPTTAEPDNIDVQFHAICDSLSQFKTHIALLQNQVKTLEKNIKKRMNGLNKESAKRKSVYSKKEKSGFAKPIVRVYESRRRLRNCKN